MEIVKDRIKQVASGISSSEFDFSVNQIEDFKKGAAEEAAAQRDYFESLVKAGKILQHPEDVKAQSPASGPKSVFFDPLSLQYALGYKDRRYALTFDLLQSLSMRLSIVAAIINTRIAQVSSFAQPYRNTKSLGYVIRHKSPDRMTTKSERKFIEQLEMFISCCGEPGKQNPYTRFQRDDFEGFIKKIVRDSLTWDQTCAEIVPRVGGIPFEFWAVDGSTIRIASADQHVDVSYSAHGRNTTSFLSPQRFQGLYEGPYGVKRRFGNPEDTIQYVQVVNGAIENTFTAKELMWGIRNPRSDLRCFPPETGVLTGGFTEKPIASIEVGDEVVTHTGNVRKVVETFVRPYKGKIIGIKTRSSKEIVKCTAQHPFLVCTSENLRHISDKESRLKWVAAEEVKIGHYVAVPKIKVDAKPYVLDLSTLLADIEHEEDADYVWLTKSFRKVVLADRNEDLARLEDLTGVTAKQIRRSLYCPEDYCAGTLAQIQQGCVDLDIDFSSYLTRIPRHIAFDEEFAFICGLWVAEGSISNDRFVNFSFHVKETYLVAPIKSWCDKYGIGYSEYVIDNSRSFVIHSKILAQVFRKLFGDHAEKKHFPVEIMSCSDPVKIKFCEGYFIGDGAYAMHKGVPNIAVRSASINLIKQLECLLNTLGHFVYPHEEVPERERDILGRMCLCRTTYGFNLCGPVAFKFDSTLNFYAGVKDNYGKIKGTHYLESENYFYLRVTDVSESEYEGTVHNFEVEKDNSYVCRYAVHNCNGYGLAEMEVLITVMTSMIYAEEFNTRAFSQGSHPKGILNFKGDNWTPEQLNAFRQAWTAQVQGIGGAWKTPITQSEGLEWINLQVPNKDMEFNAWLEFLIKLCCGVYLIDPAEINFDLHGGVNQTPLFESSQEWKLKSSRDRGLKPLLRFIAKLINKHVIDILDDHFVFEFIGLDELSEQEKHEMLKEQIVSYMTLNEGRRSLDLPDLPNGDVPMNPTYLQAVQMAQQAEQQAKAEEQQAQQAQMQQMQGGQQGQQQVGPDGQPVQQQPIAPEQTQYAGNFGKSLTREIVVTFDNWIDETRGVIPLTNQSK